MTTAITINLILAAVVFAVIVGGIAWNIWTGRPQSVIRVARVPARRERAAGAASYRSATEQI